MHREKYLIALMFIYKSIYTNMQTCSGDKMGSEKCRLKDEVLMIDISGDQFLIVVFLW